MCRWTQWRKDFALNNRDMKLAYVAAVLNTSVKNVAEFYRRNNCLKQPQYSQQEIEWLTALPLKECIALMPNRSKNALKIKKWRLCIPAN